MTLTLSQPNMRARIRTSLAAALAALATGCMEDLPRQTPVEPTEVQPNALSAYMAVSNTEPAPGTRFTVAVRTRRGSAVGPVGSFTLRLLFDTTKVRFIEAARSDMGMVMSNGATPGVLTAAGASATGFTNDELLLTTFSAVTSDAVGSLSLAVSELNSVSFENQQARLVVSPRIVKDTRPRK